MGGVFTIISGNIKSLKESIINELKNINNTNYPAGELLPAELAYKLAGISGKINREISVYLDRKGRVVDVSVGDNETVRLAEIKNRRGKNRLSGVRCVHTHPGGDPMLSSVDINSLLSLHLDAMISIGVKETEVTGIYAAIAVRNEKDDFSKAEVYGPFMPEDERINGLIELIRQRDVVFKSTAPAGRGK